uniref:Uncharacterized protein n=1 Tax=Brassica oleracea var. oleracea TaxID=109376 RepID=A0A0D3AAR2_BRAOL
MRFRGHAATWWKQLKTTRSRTGKEPINTWEKLTKHLRQTFLPHNYERTMCTRLQNLRQGSRSVDEYTAMAQFDPSTVGEAHHGAASFEQQTRSSNWTSPSNRARSQDSLGSKRVVKLGITRETHPSPYTLGWLDSSVNLRVSQRAFISFSIGPYYKDRIYYDIALMDISHLLLGRPWEYDRKIIHYGADNIYQFTWDSHKILLLPSKDSPPLKTPPELEGLADLMRKEVALARKENDSMQALLFVGTERVLICLLRTRLLQRESSFQANTCFGALWVFNENEGFRILDENKKYMRSFQIVVSACAFGGGDNLDQPIGMSKASTQKVCYVSFWDDVTLATQEAEGHKIGETLFR